MKKIEVHTGEIAAMIKKVLRIRDEIQDDEDLKVHGLNSLNSVQIAVNLEKKFGLRFTMEEIHFEMTSTIGGIADFLRRKLAREVQQ